jgi:hypothetical protein
MLVTGCSITPDSDERIVDLPDVASPDPWYVVASAWNYGKSGKSIFDFVVK